MSSIDMHVRNDYSELVLVVYNNIQEKLMKSKQQLSIIETQLATNMRESRKAELTKNEIGSLPENIKTYVSMGKMFEERSKDDILKNLKKQEELSKLTIESLKKKQKFVEREFNEATNNLKDFLHHSQKR
ncbi:hypothetical protein BB559_002406 [Furculomyces boomerangus]|uniref:Prefoldin subunit 1 n=1 Tax=Furculomyces boomerangus TaxID=61424 RepID=A0A2T9YVQ1_9FUNG|nr:hypothetical protein BB559_002406 [Furculomyces boomerangus]